MRSKEKSIIVNVNKKAIENGALHNLAKQKVEKRKDLFVIPDIHQSNELLGTLFTKKTFRVVSRDDVLKLNNMTFNEANLCFHVYHISICSHLTIANHQSSL